VNQQVRISEWQMATMMASAFTALGLFTYPRDLVEGAGRQAYWGLLAAIGVGMVSAALIVRIGLMFPGRTPIQYTRTVLGKPLGTLLGTWLVLFHVCMAAVALRYFGDLVNTLFLPRTPIEMTMLLLVAATLYINWYGLESIARFISFVFPIVMGLVTVTFVLTFRRVTEVAAILPPVSFDPFAVAVGSWRILYVFIGIEAVSMLLPYVRQPRRPYLYALSAVAANSLVLMLILVVSLGLWGSEPVLHLQYPGVATLRVLRLTGLLIERLGAFIALMWTMIGLTFLCTRFWTIPTATAQLFGLGTRKASYFLFPMALMTWFLARWPGNTEELEQMIQGLIIPLGMASNLVMTLGLMAVAWARGVGKRT
jgi:spore germination protein